MRNREWIVLFIFVAVSIATSNAIGYKTPIGKSLPGILILCGIAFVAVILDKVLPIKLPMIMYCSILGLIIASPISPVAKIVIESTAKIDFAAPLSIVGAFAGISMGKNYKDFTKQGWKMVIIALVVFTGIFIGSATVGHIILKLTKAI
ncbi:hypothetical protein CLPU_15c00590 [Gottschalkia purinilytica]|uniref:DUF340 domain-containing protein n=1 Tax=Gottschalkia purinilytica TaxID=1503 RepID=A0A0L0W8G7_GOTPU|nr:hypothetical protein [Gottschalkia purinilytica]KNF07565.1 hypothetical protein CLPU_15c00590 [Gottschalkia purinilytica]